MTEPEAQAFAARLTRIWAPMDIPQWSVERGDFYFFCTIVEGVTLIHPIFETGPLVALDWEAGCSELEYRNGEITGYITSSSDDLTDYSENVERFTADWGETFRRHCWLSGCDVQATSHEKAEWIQGFTREEIKAWNLKL